MFLKILLLFCMLLSPVLHAAHAQDIFRDDTRIPDVYKQKRFIQTFLCGHFRPNEDIYAKEVADKFFKGRRNITFKYLTKMLLIDDENKRVIESAKYFCDLFCYLECCSTTAHYAHRFIFGNIDIREQRTRDTIKTFLCRIEMARQLQKEQGIVVTKPVFDICYANWIEHVTDVPLDIPSLKQRLEEMEHTYACNYELFEKAYKETALALATFIELKTKCVVS